MYYSFLQKLVTANVKRTKINSISSKTSTQIKNPQPHDEPQKDTIFDSLHKFSHHAFSNRNNEQKLKNVKGKTSKTPQSQSSVGQDSGSTVKKPKQKNLKPNHKKNKKEKGNIIKPKIEVPPRSFREQAKSNRLIHRRLNKTMETADQKIDNERIKRSSVKRILKEEKIATTLQPVIQETEPTPTNAEMEKFESLCFNKLLILHHEVFSLYGAFRNSSFEDLSNISHSLFNMLMEFWAEYSKVVSTKCAVVNFETDVFNVVLSNKTLVLPTFPPFDFSYIDMTQLPNLSDNEGEDSRDFNLINNGSQSNNLASYLVLGHPELTTIPEIVVSKSSDSYDSSLSEVNVQESKYPGMTSSGLVENNILAKPISGNQAVGQLYSNYQNYDASKTFYSTDDPSSHLNDEAQAIIGADYAQNPLISNVPDKTQIKLTPPNALVTSNEQLTYQTQVSPSNNRDNIYKDSFEIFDSQVIDNSKAFHLNNIKNRFKIKKQQTK
ncbi:hypothetical protein RF11_03249 [Thelohanellus kitauei]|uniref:Uncharacterized protein n=1 Tax=Thelohanellus kitauei TaxID=669202 RepID=A0A0C2J029_THEKT|nr:hypothetical protein RF11_03249 [Thelohanellus kitauei]